MIESQFNGQNDCQTDMVYLSKFNPESMEICTKTDVITPSCSTRSNESVAKGCHAAADQSEHSSAVNLSLIQFEFCSVVFIMFELCPIFLLKF